MYQFICKTLSQRKLHHKILALTLPMVLSSITTPLLGLVDTAIIGHLEHSWYLGGVALGGTLISLTFWLLGFLRMSTTGISAQATGREDKKELVQVLHQGLFLSSLIALALIALSPVISQFSFYYSDASDLVKTYAIEYFSIRIFSAPATLANYVIIGWLLGTQNTKSSMWMIIVINIANIFFDLLFVNQFHWQVSGAAWASVVADYMGCLLGCYFIYQTWGKLKLPRFWQRNSSPYQGMGRLLKLNRDIFIRSLFLQSVFAFMNFKGATLGNEVIAANAVLMSFLMTISYAMDGFAYAIEAMIGKAIGEKNKTSLLESLIGTTFWALIISLLLTATFGIFGHELIKLLTDISSVQQTASLYLPWLVGMPLISMWCFLFDGVFVGATKAKSMRNSVIVATIYFYLIYFIFQGHGNHALWGAMLSFMLMRGIILGAIFTYQWRKGSFFPQP